MISRRVRLWTVAGWLALVLAGAACTLYLKEPASSTPGPQHWERVPEPASEPVPCPVRSDGGVAPTAGGCSYWQRSQGLPSGPARGSHPPSRRIAAGGRHS